MSENIPKYLLIHSYAHSSQILESKFKIFKSANCTKVFAFNFVNLIVFERLFHAFPESEERTHE